MGLQGKELCEAAFSAETFPLGLDKLPGLSSLTYIDSALTALTLWLQLSPVLSLQIPWVIIGLALGPVPALAFCP